MNMRELLAVLLGSAALPVFSGSSRSANDGCSSPRRATPVRLWERITQASFSTTRNKPQRLWRASREIVPRPKTRSAKRSPIST